MRPALLAGAVVAGLSAFAAPGRASDAADAPAATGAPQRSAIHDGLEYLVPELAGGSFQVDPGPRPFLHRFAFSPAFGRLGGERLFALRAAYSPNRYLAWEANVGHNPGESVHAMLHTLSAVVRYPLPGRIQPYGSLGYGMILVFPGESLNADPVTENVLAAGGGVELYVRNDLAVRVDARSVTVPGSATFQYGELTAGLSFYRGIVP
jgi:hypothetical protein